MEFSIPYVKGNGKSYVLDLDNLPESCIFEVVPAVNWLKFGVDNIKERAEHPGMPDVTIENLWGEKCKITRQELITSVVRLSGHRIRMSIIDSERDYEGLYVGIIKGIKVPFLKKKEEPKNEQNTPVNGEGAPQQANEAKEEDIQRILPEFMDMERHEPLKAIFIPKNCKGFFNGQLYKGNSYLVFTPDSEDSYFKTYSADRFRKLFMVPEQDSLDVLSSLQDNDTFSSDRVRKLVESGKFSSGSSNSENDLDLDLSELDGFDDTGSDDGNDPFAALAGVGSESSGPKSMQSIMANMARKQSGCDVLPSENRPRQAKTGTSSIGECTAVGRIFSGNKLSGFVLKRSSGKEIEKDLQSVIDMCRKGQITNLKIDSSTGKMVGEGIKISQLPVNKSSNQS